MKKLDSFYKSVSLLAIIANLGSVAYGDENSVFNPDEINVYRQAFKRPIDFNIRFVTEESFLDIKVEYQVSSTRARKHIDPNTLIKPARLSSDSKFWEKTGDSIYARAQRAAAESTRIFSSPHKNYISTHGLTYQFDSENLYNVNGHIMAVKFINTPFHSLDKVEISPSHQTLSYFNDLKEFSHYIGDCFQDYLAESVSKYEKNNLKGFYS